MTPAASITETISAPSSADRVQPESASEQGRLYLPQLDGLRALAFLLVFSAHAGKISPADPLLPSFVRPIVSACSDAVWFGWSGVDLFLVLSAFLITTILVREEQMFGSIKPKLFFLRRMLRIWPVYYFAVIIGLLFFPVITFPSMAKLCSPTYWSVLASDAPYLLFFVLNIGIASKSLLGPPANLLPLWSISLEEQFYLFWGVFLTLVRSQKIRYLTLAAMLIMTICVRAYLQRSCDTYLCFYENTLSRLDPLIFGAAVAFLAQQMPQVTSAVKRYGWAIFASSILLLLAAKQNNPTPFINGCFSPFCFTLVDFGWSVFLLSLLGFAPLIKFFSGKYIVQFGRLTYSMYVFHYFVLQALVRFVYHPFAVADTCLWCPIVNWCVGVPLTYLIAWLTWNLFEKRFYLLKFRFSQVPSGHT